MEEASAAASAGIDRPSGAGKSSFLRAGLLPVIPAGWRAVVTTPGNRPLTALARALVPELAGDTDALQLLSGTDDPKALLEAISRWREQHDEVLLIVDQFEELFTLNAWEVREALSKLLSRLALEADVHVLLSMRDDFLGFCSNQESLKPIFSELTPLKSLTGAALRRALVQPAVKCGYRFEDDGLVEEMVGEVGSDRGALPMLAFAAARLWDHRDREQGLLTREAYEHIGGVGGALAQHAEATLEKIGEERVSIVRELFRNLVTAQGTRAARERDELLSVFGGVGEAAPREPGFASPAVSAAERKPGSKERPLEAAEDVLNTLIDARLLTSYEVPAADETEAAHHRIEIIHESLLSNWPRLVRWQTQDADSAQLRDQIRQAARMWEERGRPEDLLWTGTSFGEYQLWKERYEGGLSTAEESFGDAMVHKAERQKRRRRIAVTAAFGILLAVLSVIAWFGWQANQERRRAEAGKLLALGEVELDTYPTATLAWATKSLELADTLEGRMLALRALQESPPARELGNAEGGKSRWWGAEFSPSGEWLAHEGVGNLWLLHRDGGEPSILARDPSFAYAQKFAFRSDGVLVVQKGAEYRWLAVPDGEELFRVERDRGRLLWPRGDGYFSFKGADGKGSIFWWPFGEGERQLVGTMADWRAAAIEAGAMAWESPEWSSEWSAIDIDASGTWIAYSRGRTILLRSLEAWSRPPLELGEHENNVTEIVFQVGGDLLAAIDEAGELRVWAGLERPGELLRTYQAEGLNGIRFDPSGRLLAAHGVVDGTATARLWDLTAPQDAEPLSVELANAIFSNALTFHPHDPWLVTINTNSAGFWPLPEEHPWVLRGHEGRVEAVAFTPDGEWLLSAAGDGVRAWPLRGQNHGAARVLLARPLVAFTDLVIHPSGESVAVGSRDGTVLLVPLNGGPVRELPGRWPVEGGGMLIAFSPDGRRLAAVPKWVAEGESIIRVWNLATGAVQTLDPDVHPAPISNYLIFDDDQRLRWVGSANDPEQQTEIVERTFDLEDGSVNSLSGARLQYGEVSSYDGTFTLGIVYPEPDSWRTEVVRVDLETGDRQRILTHGDVPVALAIDPSDQWIATSAGVDGLVRVGPVTGEEPHVLFGHRGLIRSVAISPDGHWIASGGEDGTIRVWPTPNLSKPPLHTLPHDALLARLKSLTNLRIVEDPTSASGWTIDYGPFPGWAEVPGW